MRVTNICTIQRQLTHEKSLSCGFIITHLDPCKYSHLLQRSMLVPTNNQIQHSSCYPAPTCPGLAFYHLSIYQLFFRAIPRPTARIQATYLHKARAKNFRHPYCLIPMRLQQFSSVIEVAYQSLTPHHLLIYQSFPGTIHRPTSQKSNTIVFQN